MVEIKVCGSATIRKGTQGYKRWQFVESDGETARSLEAATEVIMRLKDENTGTIKEISTEDDPQLLYIIAPASDGIVELRPTSDTFDIVTSYLFHFIIVDSVGNNPVPEHRNERLSVIDDYPPSA